MSKRSIKDNADAEKILVLTADHEICVDNVNNPKYGSSEQYDRSFWWGWRDITADMSSGKAAGANVPDWGTVRDGLSAYLFSPSRTEEIWITFHINHDYAWGTPIYPHVHWCPTTTSTGVVRWGIEYSAQKGHDQGAFPSSSTVYIEETISTDKQYQHIISEVDDDNAIAAMNLEPDTLILCRVFRDGGHANDTFPDDVAGLTVDVHYRSNKLSTIGKRPDFNIED